MSDDLVEINSLAIKIRAHALRMTHKANASHIGSCLSIADLLAVLYESVLHVDAAGPNWPGRDRFILSKGHACAAHYAVLAEKGFIPLDWLSTYGQNGGHLFSHSSCHSIPGMEVSTGSLGHGLSIGCGMALAGQCDNNKFRVFVLLSDGECNEGSTWEAVMFASHHKLANLVAIVDQNKLQAFGYTDDVLNLDPFAKKWRTFGWAVTEINGHDFQQIENALCAVPLKPDKPTCIIAHTVKGKGVSFMENQLAWHYKSPNDEQLRQALAELGVSE
jgi:transketolase